MVAKKLLVNDKITACVKRTRVLVAICRFRIEKHCLVKHLAFLKNICYQFLNFVLWLTHCYWLAHNQLSWQVLLFSCNPIGQLCLSGPGHSSHTIIIHSFNNNNDIYHSFKILLHFWLAKIPRIMHHKLLLLQYVKNDINSTAKLPENWTVY